MFSEPGIAAQPDRRQNSHEVTAGKDEDSFGDVSRARQEGLRPLNHLLSVFAAWTAIAEQGPRGLLRLDLR
jgi:hypothetical protein